ncbi:hypothetical protein [Hydrogenimonas sp.]
MASVTLSADTLWSSIAATVDTDGDQVDLNGFTLTIDQSVIPAVSWRNTKKGGRLECINTSTTDVIVINCYDRWKFYFSSDTELYFKGQLIDIASGFSGVSGQVLDSSVTSYTGDIWGVWLKEAQRWIHNHDIFTSYTPTVAGYESEFMEFVYDKATQQFTTSYYIPSTTETFQIPNIVITYQNFSYTYADMRYLNITSLYSENVAWMTLGTQYYSDGSDCLIDIRYSHLGQGGGIFTVQRDINLLGVGATGSYGVTKVSQGSYIATDCDFYYSFSIGNNKMNWLLTNNRFQIAYSYGTFRPPAGAVINGGQIKWAALPANDDIEIIDVDIVDDYDTSQYNPTGLGGSRRVYKNMKRSYVKNSVWSTGSTYVAYSCRFVDLALDYVNEISGATSLGDLWQHIDTRFVNFSVALPTGVANGLNFKYGHNEVIGANMPQTSMSNSAFSLFALDVTLDNAGSVVYGSDNSVVYWNDVSTTNGWEIVFNYTGGSAFIVEQTAGIYYYSGWYYGDVGDYMIVDLTNDYWFINEVGSFTGLDKARAAVTTYYSYDEGATWMDEATFLASTPPSPLKLWMKISWENSTDRFDYIKIRYDKAAGFAGYPSYYYDVYCRLNFLPATESMNVRWDVAGRVKEETSGLSDTMQLRVLYRDAVETGYATVRKYGWTFEKPAFQVQKGSSTIENTVDGYFLGEQKTDLTLTEAEAAAVTGVVFQSSADVDYTWELDCGGGSVENAYHYVQYRLTNFGEWAGVNTFELDEFLIRDGDKFKTVKARSGEGVKLVNYTGKVSGMTKDDGSVYVPPVDVIMTIDNIVVGSSVYIHTTDDNTEIFIGTADTSTMTATISGLNGKPYEVVIRKASSDPRYVEWTATGTIGTVDINITANQQEM